jgi:nucleotide-binding universal stress UspA family protein
MKLLPKDKKNNTVVWAVDPFNEAPSSEAVQDLLQRAKGQTVAPVYVHSLPGETLERGIVSRVDELEKLLITFVGRLGPSVLQPELLLEETGSRKGTVERLLDFSRERKAAWIALSSHGRSGLQRFVFGSFAEAVLRESTLPLYFLSGEKRKGNLALFPTDFSTVSLKAFRKFLPFASSAGLEVVLFHAISLPAPVFASHAAAIPAAMVPENYYRAERSRAKQEAIRWVKMAKEKGVKAQLHLHEEGIGLLTGELILTAAANLGVSMVAMASFSGALDRVIMGSAAFDVFRAKKFPVWICGPNAVEGSPRKVKPAPRKVKRQPASRGR